MLAAVGLVLASRVPAGDRLLFLTAGSLLEGHGVERRQHAPRERGVALRFDAPWEGPESGYASVIAVEEGYRLYYRGGGENEIPEVTCVAFSTDGVRWERPSLGLFEWNGIADTNIIWKPERSSYAESHNFFPFRDDGANVSEDERWKAVALHIYPDATGERRRMLVTLASADGLRWRRLSDGPAIQEGSFDSLNTAFRDPWTGTLRCFSRIGLHGVRFIQVCESSDFNTWTAPEPLRFDPFPGIQFYTNGILPLPALRQEDRGAWYIGMPMRFVPERKTAMGRETDGLSDAVLIASRDGLAWELIAREAWIRPGMDRASWGNAHGNQTPAHGILATGRNEWSVYWAGQDDAGTLLRHGTLRPEGFVSLGAGAGGGRAVIGPVRAAGGRLLLNAATSAVGSIRVGVLDARGVAIEGFGLEDCAPIWGDDLLLPVNWAGGAVVPADAGTHGPLRLEVELIDADLWAVRCDPATP